MGSWRSNRVTHNIPLPQLHQYCCVAATIVPSSFVFNYGVRILNSKLPHTELSSLNTGVPNPRGGLLGTGLHSRRWAVGEWVKLHLYLQPLPIAHITTWAPPPVRSAAALDSHRSANPTVNCMCKRSRSLDLDLALSLWESNPWWSEVELRRWC